MIAFYLCLGAIAGFGFGYLMLEESIANDIHRHRKFRLRNTTVYVSKIIQDKQP